MRANNRLLPACVLISLLGTFAGCGSKESPNASVSGVVTDGGTPMDGVKVTFHSTVEVNGKKNTYAAGTDSSGKYLIAAVGKDGGVPPGMYKVTVNKAAVKGGMKLPDDWDIGQAEASGMFQTTAAPKPYEAVNTTKLSVTIEPGKNEKVDFDIKK